MGACIEYHTGVQVGASLSLGDDVCELDLRPPMAELTVKLDDRSNSVQLGPTRSNETILHFYPADGDVRRCVGKLSARAS